MSRASKLPVLDGRIEARERATRTEHPNFPCRAGCDTCCRSLPHLPTITEPEWRRLHAALLQLDPSVRDDVFARLREEAQRTSGKTLCPMLDTTKGMCRVYEARPIACRTYGYYVERDGGLYCEMVNAYSEMNEVTWGNGESIAADLREEGPFRSIAVWRERASRGE